MTQRGADVAKLACGLARLATGYSHTGSSIAEALVFMHRRWVSMG